jgi:hypothetical protein
VEINKSSIDILLAIVAIPDKVACQSATWTPRLSRS